MTIAFRNLSEHDFPLLLKWLEIPHVKMWWDQQLTSVRNYLGYEMQQLPSVSETS